MTPQQFLASIDQHQQTLAAAPDPAEEFAREQFKSVVDAVVKANEALLAYMKSNHSVSVDNFPAFPDSIKTPDVAEVTKAVKALEKALKPLKQDNSDVVSAIKGLKLAPIYKPEITVSPTPVHVDAPLVKVDAPDLSPIKRAIEANKPEVVDLKPVVSALKDVKRAVDTKSIPVANVPTDPLIYYLPADIDDAGAVQYFGYTDNKGAWYIRRFDTSVSPKTLRFAFGQSDYATNYANRASLTYSVWGS